MAQLLEIVHFAIEYDHVTATRRQHRLPTRLRKVNDGKPSVTERDTMAPIYPNALRIRAAMRNRRHHTPQRAFRVLDDAS